MVVGDVGTVTHVMSDGCITIKEYGDVIHDDNNFELVTTEQKTINKKQQ
jgi:surface antigen